MKLLIAEDNAGMRELLRSLCGGPRDEVIECATGAEAVKAHAQHRPDWVLMDLGMPELDGWGAMRSILERYPDARIVVVSELPESDYAEKARLSGAVEYVSKEDLLRLPGILRQS